MATTITDGVTTVTPAVVDGYDSEREGRTLVHNILGTNVPAVTLRPAGLRTGTLRVVMASRDAALELETMLAAGSVYALENPALDVGMSFVVNGALSVSLDDTRSAWVVEIDYHEVTP